MATIIKDLGPVTAYKYAVSKGYAGTEEEFAQLMADLVGLSSRLVAVEDDVEQIEGKIISLDDDITTLENTANTHGSRISAVEGKTTTLEEKTADITHSGSVTNISSRDVNLKKYLLAGETTDTEAIVGVRDSSRRIELIVSAANGGLFDRTNSEWVLKSNSDKSVEINHPVTLRNYKVSGMSVLSESTDGSRVSTIASTSSGLWFAAQWGTAGNTSYPGRFVAASDSDRRLKENIEPAEKSGLDLVNSIDVVQFDWKNGRGHWDFGIIAQDVREKDANIAVGEETEDRYLGIDTLYLVDVLIKAVQELSAEVEELEQMINAK